MDEELTLWRLLKEFFLCTLIFALIGWWFDQLLLFLLIGTGLQLAWHLYYQYQLSQLLWSIKHLNLPSQKHSWGVLLHRIYRSRRYQRNQRRQLTANIRRFRLGAESLPDAIVVFDHLGHMIWCNRLAEELLGLQWPNDSGISIQHLIRIPEFINYIEKRDFEHPLEIRSQLDLERNLEYRVMPYAQDEWLMVVRDTSQLRELERIRRNFVANVSHELRTPLTVLQGYIEMGADPSVMNKSMRQKANHSMLQQLNRMKRLIDQLLLLSKLERETSHSDQVIDISSLLQNMKSDVITLCEKRGKDIQLVSFHIEPDIKVYGVSEQLHSAMSNLIYNAINHTPLESEINIYCYQDQTGITFKVVDKGEGIDPIHLNRLTERFYRVDKARSRDTGGSGLGLAIVKHALQHHQSTLVIQSTKGEGSCFSFQVIGERVR